MATGATVIITGVTTGLKNALAGSAKMLKQFASQTASVFSGMALFAGVQKAASMLGDYLKGAVHDAMEAERALILFDKALENTGNTTGFTRDQMLEMSKAIQETTTFTDEAALAALTMIKNFENIRGDELKRTLTASADLAESLGMDLPAAAKLAARAVADPAKGAQMLARATKGVAKLTEEEKKLIETHIAAGNTAAAQGVVLDMLEHKYGGLAKTIGESTGGRLKIFQNQLGEIQEAVGAELLPEIQKLMPELEQLAELFGETMISVIEIFAETFPHIMSFIAGIKTALADALTGYFTMREEEKRREAKKKRRAEISEMERLNPEAMAQAKAEQTAETAAMAGEAGGGGKFNAGAIEQVWQGGEVLAQMQARREKQKADRKARAMEDIKPGEHEKGKLPTAKAKSDKGDVAGTFEDLAGLWKRISTASHKDPAELAAAAAEDTAEGVDEMVAATNVQTEVLKEQNNIMTAGFAKMQGGNLQNA